MTASGMAGSEDKLLLKFMFVIRWSDIVICLLQNESGACSLWIKWLAQNEEMIKSIKAK
jgi:hypothetical protein